MSSRINKSNLLFFFFNTSVTLFDSAITDESCRINQSDNQLDQLNHEEQADSSSDYSKLSDEMSNSSNNISTSAEKRKLSIRFKITIKEDSDSEEKHFTSLKKNNYTDLNKFYNQNKSLKQNDLSENKDLNLNELLDNQEQSLYQSQFSTKQIYQMKMMKLKVHVLKI